MPIFKTVSAYLFTIILLGISVIGCSTKLDEEVKPTSPKPFTYQKYEVSTGTDKNQTVLTGFLSDSTLAELAVVNIEKNNTRRLRIYAYKNGTWELTLNTSLRPQIRFVDITTIKGQDRLITYEHGRLNWFDLDSKSEQKLMNITTNYNMIDPDKVSHIDITRDLNGDGLDDLVLPDSDGFWISTQLNNGSFTDPVKLGPPEPFLDKTALDQNRSYREVGINELTTLWYLSRLHQMDCNGDKRTDLVFWNEDHFDAYLQNTHGAFSADVKTFTTDVSFDTDGAYAIAFDFSGENMFALMLGFREKTKRRILHTFRDMNTDGISDMIIHTLEGRSIGNQRSIYEVHFGIQTTEGIAFAEDVGMTIKPRGTAGGLLPWGYASYWLQDFDNDGKLDFLFRDVNTKITGMARAMVGKSIAVNIELFRMENRSFPEKPTTKRKIRPALDFFETERVFFPPVLSGDVNGDRLLDLIVGKNWSEMHIFLGEQTPKVFAKKPQKVKVTMPNDERNIWLVDLNRDNKKDILIKNRSATQQNQVTMLISR